MLNLNLRKEKDGLSKNKRGNAVRDTIMIGVILFLVGFTGLIGHKFFTEVNDELKDDSNVPQVARDTLAAKQAEYPQIIDNASIIVLFVAWIAALMFSFFIDTHPVFLIIAILIGVFIIVALASMGNFWDEIIQDPDLSIAAADMPKLNFIMGHIAEIGIAVFLSISFVLYTRLKSG